jgi:hypothetical protein
MKVTGKTGATAGFIYGSQADAVHSLADNPQLKGTVTPWNSFEYYAARLVTNYYWPISHYPGLVHVIMILKAQKSLATLPYMACPKSFKPNSSIVSFITRFETSSM